MKLRRFKTNSVMNINTWHSFVLLIIINWIYCDIEKEDYFFGGQIGEMMVLQKNYSSSLERNPFQTEISKEFFREEICPKLIPFPPKRKCSVKYPKLGRLMMGEILDPDISQYQPNVTWKTDKDKLYTLYMAGFTKGSKIIPPSSTSKYTTQSTTKRIKGTVIDWRQWVVVNIPRSRIHEGDTLREYHPPGLPDKRLTPDYFVFLIYQQKFPINIHCLREVRRHALPFVTNTYDFALEYDLEHPIAGNYFITKRTKPAYTTVKRNTTPKSTTRTRVSKMDGNRYFFDFREMP